MPISCARTIFTQNKKHDPIRIKPKIKALFCMHGDGNRHIRKLANLSGEYAIAFVKIRK
jgi:hypothetical protein